MPEFMPLPLNSEAKYRNSILAATMYNEYLKNERSQISKHFLKKKLKSAFEREPLDKCKGFFNVPFIPSMNMFAVTNNTTNQQPNPQINSNVVQTGNNYFTAQTGKLSFLKKIRKLLQIRTL